MSRTFRKNNKSENSKGKRWLVLVVVALIAGGIFYAGSRAWHFYRWYGPVDLCDEVPFEEEWSVDPFYLNSDESSQAMMATQIHRACPEAPYAYAEWYLFRIFSGDYFIDCLLQSKGMEGEFGIVVFSVRTRKSLKPALVSIVEASDIRWSKTGGDLSMKTRGPDGKSHRSRARFIEDGEHAGKMKLDVFTEKGELHAYIKPLTAGIRTDIKGKELTREGSWYQYLCPAMMGEINGKLTLHFDTGEVRTYHLPLNDESTAHAYIEHMWAQIDRPPYGVRDRDTWDWGVWGAMERGKALMFGQSHCYQQNICSFVSFGDKDGTAYAMGDAGPESKVRVSYSRLLPDKGMYYPQKVAVFAMNKEPDFLVNLEGYITTHYFDWLGVNIFGNAWGPEAQISLRRRPVWSVIDFFKGAMKKENYPAPARELSRTCDADGCTMRGKLLTDSNSEVELWILKHDANDSFFDAKPISVMPLQGDTATADEKDDEESFSFHDPEGDLNSVYTVVPVRMVESLFYNRQQTGNPRATPSPFQSLESISTPLELEKALDKSNAKAFESTKMKEVILSGENSKVVLEKDQEKGIKKFSIINDKGAVALSPRFSNSYQIQSFDAMELDDGRVLLLWSERVRTADQDTYTSWDVFAAINDYTNDTYRVVPLSMSEDDSVEVRLSKGPVAKWIECGKDSCLKAQRAVPGIP